MAGDETHECPTCGDTFASERGVGIHHKQIHDSSIAGYTHTCAWCGETFNSTESERTYCSDECSKKGSGETRSGEGNPNWKPDVSLVCEYCGDSYKAVPSKEERSRFCSAECKAKWLGKRQDTKRVSIECEQCGCTFNVQEYRSDTARFCSRSCYNQWISENWVGPGHPNWGGGRAEYGPGWDTAKKTRVRIRDQARCQKCGMTEAEHMEEYGRNLSVHHIIPADQFESSDKRNAEENLITLCQECHAQVEQMAPLLPDGVGSPAD